MGNLRQTSIQAMSWLLLAIFSQVYSENYEQKAKWTGVKKLQFPQKRSAHKVGTEEMRGIKTSQVHCYRTTGKLFKGISGIGLTTHNRLEEVNIIIFYFTFIENL
jgi:hypothetical protein